MIVTEAAVMDPTESAKAEKRLVGEFLKTYRKALRQIREHIAKGGE